MKKFYLFLALQVLALGLWTGGVVILWGEWELLAAIFAFFFANNLSQQKMEDL